MTIKPKNFFAHSFLFAFFAGALMLFSGCAKYNPHPFKATNIPTVNNQDVSIQAHTLTEDQCQFYFSRRIIKKGFQPIQLTIKNQSATAYLLNGTDIDLELISRNKVARNLHINTFHRVASWTIPGLFFPIFLIPALIEGVNSDKANSKLDNDFQGRVIDHMTRLTIKPHQTITRVMFVHAENIAESFAISLQSNNQKDRINLNIDISF
jgi:hypothetical protein